VKPACFDFSSSNFTVQDHILTEHRWRRSSLGATFVVYLSCQCKQACVGVFCTSPNANSQNPKFCKAQASTHRSALRWPIGFLAISNSLFCLLASRAPFLLFFSPGIAGSGIGVIHFLNFFWEGCFPNAGFCEGRRRIGIPRSEIGAWNGFFSDP